MDKTADKKVQVLVGKINRLLNAGFPVWEIAKFLDLPESTVRKYKQIIDEANK